LSESDKKPFGSADIAEPVCVFILDNFAYELRAALAEFFQRLVDVVHGEHDAEVAQCVHRSVTVIRYDRRCEEARELEPAVTVGRAHHGNFDALFAQSGDTSGPFSFDRGLPFEFETEFAEEINRFAEVLDDDPNVVQPFDPHAVQSTCRDLVSQRRYDGSGRMRLWRFIAICLTALTLSLTFCHLLEMPRKLQYDEALYLAVQHSLYLYFAWVGAFAELGAVASLAVVTVLVRKRGTSFHLTLTALICVAAGLAVWFLFVSPANAEMARWNNLPLPANWIEVRRQWEFGHAASAVLDLIGFAALALSVVIDTPEAAR